MTIKRERLSESGFMPKWVWHEHLARFEFASNYVRGKVVVDCACGDGIGSEAFANSGARLVEAFDLSEEAVARATEKFNKPNLRFRVGSAVNLPLPNQSADLLISLETIEHLEEDDRFLGEVCRVLKTDGILICSTPNRRVTNPGKTLRDKPWNPFHIREYSQQEFLDLLNSSFETTELYGQNPKHSLKVKLMQQLGRLLPGHGAVRLNQMLKLPLLAFDTPDNHRVQRLDPLWDYEYLVAICRLPKAG